MIVGAIVGLILAAITAYNEYDQGRGFIGPFIAMGFVGSFAGGFLGLVVAFPVGAAQAESTTKTYGLKILNDGTHREGDFFLGSGRIDDEFQFVYYKVNSDGSAELETISADYAKIVEQDGEPRMTETCSYFTNDWWIVSWPFDESMGKLDCDPKLTFYVPENSIKSNYTLDAR